MRRPWQYGAERGRAIWNRMSKTDKEQFVYDRIRRDYWNQLNAEQQADAARQVTEKGGRAW